MDVSSALLIEKDDHYTHSNSILRLGLYLNEPYPQVARVLLCIPVSIRDVGYRLFAKYRGTIWKYYKKVTGTPDTHLDAFVDSVVGLQDESDIPAGWGLSSLQRGNDNNNVEKKKEK